MSTIQYISIFAIMISSAILIIALIAAIRSKGIKRRWLWILGCLLGSVTISLNVTTGTWGLHLIIFYITNGDSISNSPIGPSVLSLYFPIVSIIFLWKRPSLLAARDKQLQLSGLERGETVGH